MGGCPEAPGVCNATNCFGHEVDLMHFEINQAIPGRLYGANIVDSLNGTGRDRYNLLCTPKLIVFVQLFISSKVFDWGVFQLSVATFALEVKDWVSYSQGCVVLLSCIDSRWCGWCCSFGKLDDGYAFNPHCQAVDGMTPSGAALLFEPNACQHFSSHPSVSIAFESHA